MKQKAIKIAPSILSGDFANMERSIKRVTAAGADILHCDVMDGVFVPNISFGFKMIEDIKRKAKLPLDVHLMITEPERYAERFVKAGADIVTFHVEACKKIPETLKALRAAGAKRGLVINPHTSIETVLPYLKDCDMILLMSVQPGFGGQEFMPHVLEKISVLKEMIDNNNYAVDLEVDGGITLENVKQAKAAGANVIVAGSTVFGARGCKKVIAGLRA